MSAVVDMVDGDVAADAAQELGVTGAADARSGAALVGDGTHACVPLSASVVFLKRWCGC